MTQVDQLPMDDRPLLDGGVVRLHAWDGRNG